MHTENYHKTVALFEVNGAHDLAALVIHEHLNACYKVRV